MICQVCGEVKGEGPLNSLGIISIKKPGGGDSIEIGQWRCTEGSDDSKGGKSGKKGVIENSSSGGAPFLVVPERRASKAPLPIRNTKEHEDPEPECFEWHWIELPSDAIDVAGRYEVEFQYSSGENALLILGVAAMKNDDILVEFNHEGPDTEILPGRGIFQGRLSPLSASAMTVPKSGGGSGNPTR